RHQTLRHRSGGGLNPFSVHTPRYCGLIWTRKQALGAREPDPVVTSVGHAGANIAPQWPTEHCAVGSVLWCLGFTSLSTHVRSRKDDQAGLSRLPRGRYTRRAPTPSPA